MMSLRKSLVSLSILFISPLSSQGQSSEETEQGYWTDRYLSVSYPLKTIEVTSPYGLRKDPFTGERVSHSGLDLRAVNENVMAMFDGTVERVGSDSRSGNFITLRHGEYTVSYCHLSRIVIEQGAAVYAGDIVGVSGDTGRATGPHLHITARRNGELTDPYDLILFIRNTREECVNALIGHIGVAMSKDEFFLAYAPVAMEHQQQYGIPASVTLAQASLESADGGSRLARLGNNYFGIKSFKGDAWYESNYILADDDLKGERFRVYGSVADSFTDHSRLLMTDRYKRCRKYSALDYHHWLVEIKRAGYATAKDYVQRCESIIRKYSLYLYDRLAAGK